MNQMVDGQNSPSKKVLSDEIIYAVHALGSDNVDNLNLLSEGILSDEMLSEKVNAVLTLGSENVDGLNSSSMEDLSDKMLPEKINAIHNLGSENVDGLNAPSVEDLSDEILSEKVDAIHALCSENKINSSNAFDHNMPDYFHALLRRKKFEAKNNEEMLEKFQNINDYLESIVKIYSYRIDNVSETIMDLRNSVKNNKKTYENNQKSSKGMMGTKYTEN